VSLKIFLCENSTTLKIDTSDMDHNEQVIASQKKHIADIEKLLADTEKRAKSFESDWSNLFDQNKTLREANHQLQQGYETLRIQKGGFGFKMLLASGMGGFVTALILCFVYLKLKPKPDYIATFDQFRRENLFDFELNLSNGNFEEVEESLRLCSEKQAFHSIQPEIYFTQKVVGAAKRYCKPSKK
jgi:hypothetical protein